MNVELESKCTITNEWFTIAKFVSPIEANWAACALSKEITSGSFRTTDYRWPEEGVSVTVYTNGELVA